MSKLQLKIKNFKSQKGFTLVELILYMGIVSIFLFVLVDIFISILDVQTDTQSSSNVSSDGRFLLARLSYDISRADMVSVPATFSATTNTLQLVINNINYTYSLQNGNLVLINNLGADALNGYDTTVSNVSFTKLGTSSAKPTIRANFTVQSKILRKQGAETKTFQTTVGLR